MAEHNFAEKLGDEFSASNNFFVFTGDDTKSRQLLYELSKSIRRAKKIDIAVAFLRESGVRLLLDDLKAAVSRAIPIRILTGNYLGITQPAALYIIKRELGTSVQLKFYNEKERSFHPKAYFFHYENSSEVFIGSSNISKSALTNGIEWNYKLNSHLDKKSFYDFYNTFEDLFENHAYEIDEAELKRYAKSWKKPSLQIETENHNLRTSSALQFPSKPIPHGVQVEALYALQDTRLEGAEKALIHAATGIGKTYLAAFDSEQFQKVLFVAHRDEILSQAAETFCHVRNCKQNEIGFFCGSKKQTDKNIVFASVATLGQPHYLCDKFFRKDFFDYIIIDEFHHATATNYKNIIAYFKPRFLLGLTATPERLDGRDIYSLCDYNVPYEITLKDAINKGVLVPFHYYGIFDEVNYSHLKKVKGKYAEKDLNNAYVGNQKRSDLIYKNYKKYFSERAIGFCASRIHAEEMSKEFSARGIKAVAVYSEAHGEFSVDRKIALTNLASGKIKVIFCVDMFNEGVDVPNIDMVMFLRPTESPVIFLQQLGRGLRKSYGKKFLTVLDFIGNYEKANKTPFLLRGDSSNWNETAGGLNKFQSENFYPDDCIVDFDLQLIDLFEKMNRRNLKIKDIIREEYFRVKNLLRSENEIEVENSEQKKLQRALTRTEFFENINPAIYEMCLHNSKENPFNKYLTFLHDTNELDEDDKILYESLGREFLQIAETTSMTKVYKMPVLLAFYNDGNILMDVTKDQLLRAWKNFFCQNANWKDYGSQLESFDEYKKISDTEHLQKIMSNPVKYLQSSSKGFFVSKDGFAISLRNELESIVKTDAFKKHFADIINYRTKDYYLRRYEKKIVHERIATENFAQNEIATESSCPSKRKTVEYVITEKYLQVADSGKIENTDTSDSHL